MNPDRGGSDPYPPPSPGDSGNDWHLVSDPRTDGQVKPLVGQMPSPRGDERRGNPNDPSDVELERGGLQDGGTPQQLRRGRDRGGFADSHYLGDGPEDFSKESLPPCASHEVEVLIKDAASYTLGQSTRSPQMTVGNFRFRILVFPGGSQNSGGGQVSAFVEADPIEGLDPRWVFAGVKYQITVVNWIKYTNSVTKSDNWTFSKEGVDRGWHEMLNSEQVASSHKLSQETGWLGPDNTLCLRASCYVRQADSISVTSDYNIRKETGHIGLMNHGATCYMNGLLQSLFHVGEFRRIVYSLEVEEKETPDSPGKDDKEITRQDKQMGSNEAKDEDSSEAPPLIQALQNVFYRLQTSDQAVNCRELMKSFGWDTMDAFTQHDAQELNRILCDRLEEQMKGTVMDGSIKRLFEGEYENYIDCVDVDYQSRRNETYYDLQLNIKSERGQELRNLEEALRDFTAEETLEGDNAYEAEGHGKQRAKKGIRFSSFPPVLNLQLKRFHFDLEKMDMVKLNTRFEFSRRLDLAPFAPGAGAYVLHAVVVHSGDVNSGHYYAHIRPTLENHWYKFDDDTVTPCSEYAAIEDNFGGNDLAVWNYFDRGPRDLRTAQTPTRPRIHNAYMLVYIREDLAAKVLETPDPKIVNNKMVDRCDKEVRMAEQRRREKMEQQLKIRVRVVMERDLRKMSGFWDHAEISHEKSLKMGRDQLIKELAVEFETMNEVPRSHIVFFSLHYRNNPRQVRFAFMPPNTTFRSHIPQFNAPHFDTSDPYLTVLAVAAKGFDVQTLKWAPSRADMKPDELSRWHDDTVTLLIVKYFCPQMRKIVTLGCYYTASSETLFQMVTDGWVNERLKSYVNDKQVASIPEDQENMNWTCWEEFSERDIQPRSVRRTVKNEQLWSGDVIIWQLSPKAGEAEADPNANVDAASRPLADGETAPVYPVNTAADWAAHLANSVDVSVVLHDAKQPLCLDGVVATGNWGPVRPQSAELKVDPKKDGGSGSSSAVKEERPEDAQLALSPSQFAQPREAELKMDLRWHLHHVTGTINKTFGMKPQTGETQLLLFNSPPASTMEEPLNLHTGRNEQTVTLKDLRATALNMATQTNKKTFKLHAVELPFQLGRQVLDRGCVPLCVRFYDEAVREVGSCVISVSNNGTVTDILTEARPQIKPEWGITGTLRIVEVSESRISKVYRPEVTGMDRKQQQADKEAPVRQLMCIGRGSIFYHCLRVEADIETADSERLIEIFHCDRQTVTAFAQPLVVTVTPGEKAGSIKTRCKTKLRVADGEFKSWRLVRVGRGGRTHLKDDESWDGDSADAKLCLEHVNPAPSSCLARQSRHNKALFIK